MRSTQRLLENPLALETGNREARLEALQQKSDAVTTEVPDLYVDHYQWTIMEAPCNIKPLPQNPDIYIDKKYVESGLYQFCPVGGASDEQAKAAWVTAWNEDNRYRVDKKLAARIEAWLQIQEIIQYLRELLVCDVISTAESLQACGAEPDDIPKSFFSKMPGGKVMTFPVMLDNNPRYIIDFDELLSSQPTPESIIEGHYREYLKESISKLQGKFGDIALLLDACSLETLPQEEADRIFQEQSLKYQEEYNALRDEKTLEWYKENLLRDEQLVECYNPFTKLPVKAIAIQYDLMMDIDQFVAAPFKWQHRKVRQIVEAAEPAASYAEVLVASNYPRESIPEAILCGYNPCQPQHVKVMNHPVLINEQFYVDYADLEAYWKSATFLSRLWSGSREGLNPMNGEPLISIRYDSVKKNATDHFMANRESFRMIMTQRDIKNPNFLHKTPGMRYFESSRVTRKKVLLSRALAQEEPPVQPEVFSM
jgi:hypothetical protein